MGAGDYAAGVGPAGFDPPVSTGPSTNHGLPRALYFDAGLKDFPIDDDGRYIDAHPVDQKVNLALGVQQGKVANATDLGSKLMAIPYGGGPQLTRAVEMVVRSALASLLKAGDIEIDGIEVEPAAFGGFAVAVSWFNLRSDAALARNRDNRRTTSFVSTG